VAWLEDPKLSMGQPEGMCGDAKQLSGCTCVAMVMVKHKYLFSNVANN